MYRYEFSKKESFVSIDVLDKLCFKLTFWFPEAQRLCLSTRVNLGTLSICVENQVETEKISCFQYQNGHRTYYILYLIIIFFTAFLAERS